ncbi:hypothetical protein V5O48_007322 [Marasmius crinis-equi]|uniref:GDP-fucose protein O-fucosyltransferase 2 n=1 Tax=Marasmius crinis-equi TaxID=585013 RepID=A0ABR3FH10_9AGAR
MALNPTHSSTLSGHTQIAANKWPVKFRLETGFSLNNWSYSKAKDNEKHSPWAASNFVEGPPADSLRSNLKNNVNYLTSWANAGFTNEFMGIANMMYLAMLTERVPIIPPFAPRDHISREGGFVAFGDIFDLDHYREAVRQGLVEWRDIKKPSEPYLPALNAITNQHDEPAVRSPARSQRTSENPPNQADRIGCWSIKSSQSTEPAFATSLLRQLNLDVSYTKVPLAIRTNRDDPGDNHVDFWKMAGLLFPPPLNSAASTEWIDYFSYHWQKDMRQRAVTEELGWTGIYPSRKGHRMVPDDHLACLDMAYYMTTGVREFEWTDAWSPAWRFVGRHLRFREGVLEVANGYLRRAFGIKNEISLEIPPFISVHMRRGDFAQVCKDTGKKECYPKIANYVRMVEEVKEELRAQKGLVIERILVASNEAAENTEFWDQIKKLGWTWVNHGEGGEQTLYKYGEWYAPILDVAIQSMSIGFVGSRGSTFSLVSARRVEEWNDGIFRMASDTT